MGLAGNIFQVLGLVISLGAVGVFFYAYKEKSQNYLKLGNYLYLSVFLLIVVASIILTIALTISDFSIEYIAMYTDRSLPIFYRISAFWAGQAGSLLFWVLLLVIFTAIEIWRLKDQPVQYRAIVYMVLAASSAFFILLCVLEQNPFKMLDFIPSDGQGMNPMLQNPGMVIHPPTLYVGYVGFNIILAHAFAALITKDLSVTWVRITRNWALVIWVFLTAGIVIGGWWAYVELGWGGYWAWDPVENASLLPWLTATAFIHSSLIYEKRGRLKGWAFFLILLTFELTIFGTFITRSGVIESVHSFGRNPIGTYFIWFIVVSAAIYLYILFRSRKILEDKVEFKYLSREGIFFIANWLFLGATFVIMFGTILPWLSELFTGQKTTVELSYFNRVSIPFFSAILLASGIAPLITYGDYTAGKFFKRLIPSAVVMVIAVVLAYISGHTLLVPLILIAFTAFSLATVFIRIGTLLKVGGVSGILKAARLYGAMIIHLGVIAIAFGITMSSFYNKQIDVTVEQNSNIQMEQYTFQIGEIHIEEGPNYTSTYLPIKIYEDDKFISDAFPEMRLYDKQPDQSFAEVAYYSMIKGDLYFILSGYDLNINKVRVQALIQPFIGWIWVGCALMCFGGLFSIVNIRRKTGK